MKNLIIGLMALGSISSYAQMPETTRTPLVVKFKSSTPMQANEVLEFPIYKTVATTNGQNSPHEEQIGSTYIHCNSEVYQEIQQCQDHCGSIYVELRKGESAYLDSVLYTCH